MEQLTASLLNPVPYAENQLALLVPRGNPKHIAGFQDLCDPAVTVAMPNPATEGIARLAKDALRLAAGKSAVHDVFQVKSDKNSTRFTTVHHRETVA